MQHSKGPEFPEPARTVSRSRSRSRSTSLSSDSQLSRIRLRVPPAANPAPSFIAPSAASQIITADQEFNAADFADDDEEDDSTASAIVTPDALAALNGFLDHLLYNILAAAKSTQLSSIRPAVAEVLKPRLAKEVVSVADEELSEYLGGPEDEQLEFRGGQTPNGDFDLIRTWKLTRLRCMVYTRLGDMEEDDEEEFITQDGLGDEEGAPRRFSNHVGNITPAAAIFLTSIIEHIGERALVIVGETARSRLSSNPVVEDNEDGETGKERGSMNRLVVEELDVEKLALNPTMGRLWRTWRKRTRTPQLSRMASTDSIIRRGTIGHLPLSRKSSFSVADESHPTSFPPFEAPPEINPASVPLPETEDDAQQIENLGFMSDGEGGEIQTMEAVVAHKVRPRSLMVLTIQSPRSPSNGSPATPNSRTPVTRHVRSKSLPSNSPPPKVPQVDQAAEQPSPTASERRRHLETMYEHDEQDPMKEKETEREMENEKEVETEEMDKQEGKLENNERVGALPHAPEPFLHISKEQPQKANDLEEEHMERSALQETTARLSLSTASLEIVTSPATTNTEDSSTFFFDQDTEALEGQEICEKPIATATERPTRKSSKDITRREERSAASTRIRNERVVGTAVEDPLQRQREDHSTSVQLVAAHSDFTECDANPPVPEPLAREVRQSTDIQGKWSRPVSNSSDSTRSSYSRTHRPSPLVLKTGSHRSGVSVSSSGTERAAVQRISGRPSPSAASATVTKSRRSDSFGSHREKRPVTAGSSNSQVSSRLKGIIGRPCEPSSPHLRSSSETSRVSGLTKDSYDDTSGLDELIRSEETIHYTLTPKSVREMDFPDTSRWQPRRSNTSDLADFLKNTGPDDSTFPRASTTSSRGVPDYQSQSRIPDLPNQSRIHATQMPPKSKQPVGQPRDVRPSTESSHDFAQFIRNSGPNTPSTPSTFIKGRGFSEPTELSKKPSRAESTFSSSSRTRLLARPAVVPNGDTSDLIDFIREGPPTAGARRIPRTVAPFRNTMDSDELNLYEPQVPPVSSTQQEVMATKSHVSAGSRTGLLDSMNRSYIRTGSSSSKVDAADDPRPQRTQRRAPDPYALDWGDDELTELMDEPKPKREEESLIDFLRNAPPPQSESQPQPFVLNNNNNNPSAKPVTGGFGGASSMKARLLRNTSFERAPSTKSSRSSLRQQFDQQSPGISSNYAAKVGMERNTGAMRGLSFASERQTETSALADFLRSTGPPEPPAPRAQTPVKDSSFTRRLFMRHKKVQV
ncbi:hypothetical protein P175DRAFT_0489460 [Aspergillus ochraceoroseus IBT 24754]|uniref:Uncharacterized protein n=2 Tax=Aspergillus ochraceoroseus TaxID=138278 RepID=A0A2T5M727_9EURO|nr:uncharacterized protein P175DRAFT_0489460 [Aspergillus ochraceoroseus IBT 24754]KKK12129.1 hypothetical protein AOCH_002667 [Aspergillus ochraceoroseus]PTU24332.1 hypothetical protein P175DRAFT_0489460 [Aspergillus ochraceoroseus IBT 24754]